MSIDVAEFPFQQLAFDLSQRVVGSALDEGLGALTLPACPQGCGSRAFVQIDAIAGADAVWCEAGCPDEQVDAGLRRWSTELPIAAAVLERDERFARTRAAFPLLDLAALVNPNRAPRRWTWEGIVPEGESVALVAPAGVGKSLLIEALCVFLATGATELLGRALNFPDDRRELIVDLENSEDDLSERFLALGVSPSNVYELSKRLHILHLPQLRGLDTAEGARQLFDVLDAYGIRAGDLLVLDSTQRVTEGDENSNDTMRRSPVWGLADGETYP